MDKVIPRGRNKLLQMYLSSLVIFFSVTPLLDNIARLLCVLSFVAVMFVLKKEPIKFYRNDLLGVTFLLSLMLMRGLVTDLNYGVSYSLISLMHVAALLLGLVLATLVPKAIFIVAIENLTVASLLIGLPLYLITLIFPSVLSMAVGYGDFEHVSFGVVNILLVNGQNIERFSGFASEPGLSQIFFAIALCSRLISNGGRLDWASGLILSAMILGKSTLGVFLIIYVISATIPMRILKKYIFIYSPLVLLFFIVEFRYHFEYKLIGSESFAGRYERYLNFFSEDLGTVILGYGNHFYEVAIAPLGLGGWDSFLQVSQRYGLITTVTTFIMLIYAQRKSFGYVSLIIFAGFFSQSIWLMPAISYFYFSGPFSAEN